MNLKISFFNKILRNTYFKKIRNLIGIRPSFDLVNYSSDKISVSDAFFWRTDNNFETIFKFTNILKYFYNAKSSNIKLLFYSNINKLLKEYNILSSDNFHELKIDKLFLDNIEGYGVFYIFHETNEQLKTIVRNSCYVGYSLNNNLPSMVHGNTIASQKKFNNKVINHGIGGYSYFKKFTYIVQNRFNLIDTEIMLVNPTNKKISIRVNEMHLNLKKGYSKIVQVGNNDLIKITSNCYLLRPIVFERINNFINVYHG